MAKPCDVDGCENPRFSNKKCRFHQHLRTDEKWIKSQEKQKSKPKSSVKKKPKKKTGELELFLKIWMEMPTPRKCDHCGKPQLVFFPHCFAHIKPKGTHPELRLNKDNIWFSCHYFDDKHGWYGCHTSQTFESKEKFNARKELYNK